MAKHSDLRIKFVKPGDTVTPRRKPTREEVGLRHDMSQFYSLKATLESLFGRPIYIELKESADMADWRKATKRLLDAISLSVRHTVRIADEDWFEQIDEVISHGQDGVRCARTAADLFSVLAATLTEIVFIQLGFMPTRSSRLETVPLARDFWELNSFRSVQYVQSREQKLALAEYRAGKAVRQPQPS